MLGHIEINGIKVSHDSVLVANAVFKHESNPHKVHGFLVHEHGFAAWIVFASCLQDALDELVDNDYLDAFLIEESDYKDYGIDTDNPTCTFLGDASEPFDIENLSMVEFDVNTLPVKDQLLIMNARCNGDKTIY